MLQSVRVNSHKKARRIIDILNGQGRYPVCEVFYGKDEQGITKTFWIMYRTMGKEKQA